jgi:hypothetical protein
MKGFFCAKQNLRLYVGWTLVRPTKFTKQLTRATLLPLGKFGEKERDIADKSYLMLKPLLKR